MKVNRHTWQGSDTQSGNKSSNSDLYDRKRSTGLNRHSDCEDSTPKEDGASTTETVGRESLT